MAAIQEKEASMSDREKRAHDRYLRLAYIDDETPAVQKRKDDGTWGSTHILTTNGSDAVDCGCMDRQMRDVKCYHMHAWEMWTFDEILFADGEREEL